MHSKFEIIFGALSNCDSKIRTCYFSPHSYCSSNFATAKVNALCLFFSILYIESQHCNNAKVNNLIESKIILHFGCTNIIFVICITESKRHIPINKRKKHLENNCRFCCKRMWWKLWDSVRICRPSHKIGTEKYHLAYYDITRNYMNHRDTAYLKMQFSTGQMFFCCFLPHNNLVIEDFLKI